ncbi:MAG: cobyric acid synthase [Pseudolysinimonas sp.]
MIRIMHLYPRELGINGDVGNVMALRRRAQWRSAEVEVVDVGPGDELPAEADLVHVGSGPASSRQPLHADVARHAARLRDWVADGVPFVAIAAGWQLLGNEVTELDGSVSIGAGVFPSSSTVTSSRIVGEVAGESELGEIAGFVNYGAHYAIEGRGVKNFARLTVGGDEGLVVGHLVATNLHGPFLPMNPVWADHLLDAAAQHAGIELGEPDSRTVQVNDYARRARAAIRGRL